MNKRGFAPYVWFFIAAFVLYNVVLFSYISFDGRFSDGSEGVSLAMDNAVFYENYLIKESEIIAREVILSGGEKEEFRSLALERSLGIKGLENYYGKVFREDFDFKVESDDSEFEIKDVVISVSSGNNKIDRRFSFEIKFDSDGDAVKIEKG